MTTPLDLITDALQKLAVYAPGETISSADTSRSLQMLSDMIDEWSDDSIQLFQITNLVLDLQVGVQQYFVGPGGNVVVAQPPQKVSIGPGAASANIAGIVTPVDSVSQVEWNAIYNSGSAPSGTPTVLFYLPSFPLASLSVTSVPDAVGTLTFAGWYPLFNFTASITGSNVTLAPGQQLAMASNLAMWLHTYFMMGTMSTDLAATAQQSKTLLTLTHRVSRAMSGRNVAPMTPVAPKQ